MAILAVLEGLLGASFLKRQTRKVAKGAVQAGKMAVRNRGTLMKAGAAFAAGGPSGVATYAALRAKSTLAKKGQGIAQRNIKRAIRKAPIRKAPVRKAPVRKAPVRKAPVRKAPVRKAPVRKAPVRKAPVRKAPVRKAPVRKAPVRKAPVRKAPVRKAPVRKAPVKKTASRPAQIKKNRNASISFARAQKAKKPSRGRASTPKVSPEYQEDETIPATDSSPANEVIEENQDVLVDESQEFSDSEADSPANEIYEDEEDTSEFEEDEGPANEFEDESFENQDDINEEDIPEDEEQAEEMAGTLGVQVARQKKAAKIRTNLIQKTKKQQGVQTYKMPPPGGLKASKTGPGRKFKPGQVTEKKVAWKKDGKGKVTAQVVAHQVKTPTGFKIEKVKPYTYPTGKKSVVKSKVPVNSVIAKKSTGIVRKTGSKVLSKKIVKPSSGPQNELIETNTVSNIQNAKKTNAGLYGILAVGLVGAALVMRSKK